jgi:tetratricopeptide (TPR) repeat protein
MNKTKLPYRLLLIFMMISQSVYCSEVDSLEQVLSKTHDALKKIELYTQLSSVYKKIDLDKSSEYLNLALSLSEKIDSDMHKGEIYSLFGDIAVIHDSLNSAQEYYEKATEYLRNEDQKLAGVYLVLGNIHFTHDDLANAMQYYLKSVEHIKKAKDNSLLPLNYVNIGAIYFKTRFIEEALKYFSKALELVSEDDKPLLISTIYSNLGLSYVELNEFEIANKYLYQSLAIYREQKALNHIANIYAYLARAAKLEQHYEKALVYLDSAQVYLSKEDQSYAGPKLTTQLNVLAELGEVNLKTGNYKDALIQLKQTYQLGKKNQQLSFVRVACDQLYKYWESVGNTDSAFFYHKLFKLYSDSLNNEDNIRKLEFQKAKFMYEQELLIEKQARENESAINRRNIIILFIAVFLLILILVLLSLFLKLSRNRTKQAELEQKNLRNELELRNKELTTHLMYQVKNNEFILNISKKLKELYNKSKPENKQLLNDVIRKMELDASSDQWEEFEVRFQQVHTDFYKNLGKKFPDLSSNELRLCAFLRLNMNTKDIAAITYQSTNSITVARWRLRQKFGLNKEESLTAYLTQF